MSIEKTLAQRAKTHGNFNSHAEISQQLKVTLEEFNYKELGANQREALDMICHKMARILNGNPNTYDHWHDIAGYATLVANELK